MGWKERSPEDLDRIGKLVRTAVGFDEKRGDKVEVVSMRFVDEGTIADPAPSGLLGTRLETADILSIARSAAPALVGVLALLLILRPMVFRLTAGAANDAVLTRAATGAAGGMLLAPSGATALASDVPRIAGPAGAEPAEASDVMISISNVEGQLRASSVRHIAGLVELHPEESLAIVRGWMEGAG